MSQIYRIPPKQRLTQFTGEWCVIVKSPKMFWIVSYLKGYQYPGAIDDKLTINLTMFWSSGNIKCQFIIADKLPFLTTFQPKQSRIWKKSSSTSQKTLRLVRAKTCSPAAEGMGLTRITSLLSLSLNVLLSHQDLLKDFYLNSTHSVPSILLWPIFFFLSFVLLLLLLNASWQIMLGGDGCFSTLIISLSYVVQGTQHGTSFINSKQAGCHIVQWRKCLFYFRSFTGSLPLFLPLLFHNCNVNLAYFIVSISTAV